MYHSLALFSMMLVASSGYCQSILSFSSSSKQVTSIELFTSHGCSSCPPADKWLRQYIDHPALWTEIIPMAFHVDYWDHLGWRDTFADPEFTQRQQHYALSGRISSVYTPAIVIRGNEWRGFFRRHQPNLSVGEEVGSLNLNTDLKSARISFESVAYDINSKLTAHIAVLGFGIESSIGNGENRGRILVEDFVVLGHNSSQQQITHHHWQLAVPSKWSVDSERLAIVAWLSELNSPAPVQTVGGWLPEDILTSH